MAIKLIKKTNEADVNKFDVSGVIEDSKKFDFINLLSRLNQFKNWAEELHGLVYFTMPKIHDAASGSSGYSYRISNEDRSSTVQFSLHAGTNPERYPEFEGFIYAGSERFPINSINDLTDKLIDDIVAAVKEFA